MASGAAPCSEQRASAGEKEKGGGGGRGRGRSTAAAAAMNTPHSHTGFGHCEACVVCGDRACNHHYYGVAACHGCKCFFWRSIKNKLKYICRGDGDCDINPNHRNACRYCRLQRCLKAGMQPDAVRMPKPMSETEMELAKLEKEAEKMLQKQPQKEAGQCPMCHNQQQQQADGHSIVHNDMVYQEQLIKGEITKNGITESGLEIALEKQATPPQLQMTEKLQEERSQQLVKRLVLVEMTINEVADFSENEAPKRQLRLDSLFDYPEFLDRFRTQVNYCVRLRRVTEEEMEFCKYRTLTKVVDYIRALSTLDPTNMASTEGVDQLTVQDKIVLLRHGFAPLVLFDIAAGTSFATKDTHNLLCLPTGLTLCAGEAIVPNTFLSQQIIGRCIGSLVRLLTELQLDQEEFVLMKLIIALALDSASEEDVNLAVVEEQSSEDFPTAPMAQFCPAASNGHSRAVHGGQQPQLSTGARQFVDQLRDWAHAALYRHPPKRSSAGASSSSSSASSASSEAALRFAKLLHILPKLTLLSRDLVEHIRMVHTFPSTRTRPTDPLFFQLFGDIFHENQQRQQSRASLAALLGESSPFSGTDLSSPFGSPVGMERQQQQRDGFVQHQMMSTGGSGCPVHAKMISPQYKLEYGGSPDQWQHLDQPPPMFSSSSSAGAGATYAIGGGMFSGKGSSS